MSYKPKTNWKYDDTPTETDFNRIEKGVGDAHSKLGAQDGAIEDLVNKVDNMYKLTDGPYAKTPPSNDFNDLKKSGFYAIPNIGAVNAPVPLGGQWKWLIEVLATPIPGFSDLVLQTATSASEGGRKFSRTFNWFTSKWESWYPHVINSLDSTSSIHAASANTVKQLNDLKANKAMTPVTLTFQNGWRSSNLMCYMDGAGVVHLSGSITGGSQIPEVVLMTIPVGFRPISGYFWLPVTTTAGIDSKTIIAYHAGSGTIRLDSGQVPYANIHFDTSFRTI